jgi:UDP-N-acetylmuramoylalanine--D-glutamate ligase
MELKNKKILVVGFGRTGEALVEFLVSKNANGMVSEIKRKEEMGERIKKWMSMGVEFEFGEHKEETFLRSDLIILSPGIPPIPQIERAKAKGIKVISEIELAFYYLKGKIIGVTGSNGKSTTTTLIYMILKESGLKTHLAGNIGFPLISYVSSSSEDEFYIVELSSFQLKYIEKFQPYVAVFLNIAPDHLDWHVNFEDYYESKKNIFSSQTSENFAILNADDHKVWSLRKDIKAQVYPFSRKKKFKRGAWLENEYIFISTNGTKMRLNIRNILLRGPHNQENIMASAIVSSLLGISEKLVRKAIYNFRGLEHRLEKVTDINGVEFYNDSKATNVDATLKSLQSFERNIILILGGRDKHGDFTKLKKEIEKRVKKVVLIGEAKEKIRKAVEGAVSLQYAESLGEAVRISFNSADKGDIVLLAPACASFDMFENFEHRGKVFKEEVFKLKKQLIKNV